ncbi:hypothetical protein AB0N64_02230 [Microbacterium sp. NPDC089318]
MSEPETNDSLAASLKRGRRAAERTILDAIRDGQSWKEETVTDNLTRAIPPFMKYTTFNRHEESRVGADWMWWWVDEAGEAFGMLLQAKRPDSSRTSNTYDIGAKGGQQIDALLTTARQFGLAPGYALYAEPDPEPPEGDPRTVSLLPGVVALWLMHDGRTAEELRAEGVPLEHLGNPAPRVEVLAPILKAITDAELLAFLDQPQVGARRVAKHLLANVAEHRMRLYDLATAQHAQIDTQAVFANLPADRGHSGEPYFEHILRGLRKSVPAYVLDVLADEEVDAELGRLFAGIAVVRC